MEGLTEFIKACTFSTPVYFWIAAAAMLVLIFVPWIRRKKGLALDLRYWKEKVSLNSKRYLIMSVPVVIITILMASMLLGPQVTTKTVTNVYGYPVMLVVDVSGSMGTGYTKGANFNNAFAAYDELVTRRSNINFGLLIFSTENYISRYFINKDELFQDTLQNKEEVSQISKGTRVYDALVKAHQFFNDNIDGKSRVIILITDLDVDSTEMSKMVEEMTRISLDEIRLYVIAFGVGMTKKAQIPNLYGLKMVDLRDKSAIDQICEEISLMQMVKIREEEQKIIKNAIPILFLPVIGLTCMSLILSEGIFRKIP